LGNAKTGAHSLRGGCRLHAGRVARSRSALYAPRDRDAS